MPEPFQLSNTVIWFYAAAPMKDTMAVVEFNISIFVVGAGNKVATLVKRVGATAPRLLRFTSEERYK